VENHGKSTEECWDFASINNVLNRTYKTGGYEQAEMQILGKLTKTFPVELLLLDQNIFTDMAERIS
jgi:hypothetical protein